MQRIAQLSSQIQEGTQSRGAANTKYRYTHPNAQGILTPAQRDFYEENGFLVIKGLFSEEKIDRYTNRFSELVSNPSERSPNLTVMRDIALAREGIPANDERLVTKIQEFQNDETLFGYCKDAMLLRYVSAFCGSKGIYASHTMLINKPVDPGQGTSRHPLHQDQVFFPFQPADLIVCAWTAMQKINRENGCLVVVPGTHRTGEILEHGYPDWEAGANLGYVGILGLAPSVQDNIVHLVMDKGDTVFFHPILYHGSGRNQSQLYRKAISCHFISAECEPLEVGGTIQEDEEEGLRKLARPLYKRMAGKQASDAEIDTALKMLTMKDMWTFKSRLVMGEGTFQNTAKQLPLQRMLGATKTKN